MQKQLRWRRGAAILLALVFLAALAGTALADGVTLEYKGAGDRYGSTVDGKATAIMLVTDGTHDYPAYCLDSDVYVKKGEPYVRTNIDAAEFSEGVNKDKIRAIVMHSIPAVSLDTLKTNSGVGQLTETQAITATQLAIWNAINPQTFHFPDQKTKDLFDYFSALANANPAKTPMGSAEIKVVYEEQGSLVRATFQYRFIGKNADGSAITGTYSIDKDLVSTYGATIDASENGDWHVVTISGLPADAAFNFKAAAAQQLDLDAYFYQPVNGKTATQCLIGPYQGTAEIEKSEPYRYVPTCGFSLRILKVDSKNTEKGLAGAVFEISPNPDFSNPVYTVTTGEDGRAVVAGLREGTYYVREKTPPPGYMPYTDEFSVEVNQYTREQMLKNTAYGQISIYKCDENELPVKGARFALYRGDTVDPSKLISDQLITDENGLIFSGNLEPGTYTALEVEAPEGYHLNTQPATVTVNSGETARVVIENETIKRGTLNFFKRDAETTEQLAGAVLAVYSDPECENELHRVTTKKTEAVSVTDLMPGTYYARELQVPENYQLDDTIQTVVLEEGKTVAVTFYNVYIPKTAGNYGLLLLVGGISLAGCLGVGIVFRKRLFGAERE